MSEKLVWPSDEQTIAFMFLAVTVSLGVLHMDAKEMHKEKTKTIQKCFVLFWTNPPSSTSQNSSCMATCCKSKNRHAWSSIVDTGCSLEPGVMVSRGGWQETIRELFAAYTTWWWGW